MAYTPFGGVGFGFFCFGLLSAIGLLGACSRTDIESAIGFQPPQEDAIQFDFSFERPRLTLGEPDIRTAGYPIDTGINPAADATALPFRYRTRFVSGDAVGIYVVEHGPGTQKALSSDISGNYANNVKIVYDGTKWVEMDSIYHPRDSELDIYAYYPYQPNSWYGYPLFGHYPPDPNDIPFTVNANQNDPPDNFYGSDFVFGALHYVPKGFPTRVNMELKHAMALVEAKVYYTSPGPSRPDSTTVMSLVNVKSVTSVVLSDSSTKAASTTRHLTAIPPRNNLDSIVMHYRGILTDKSGATNVDTAVYWAVVPAQNIAVGNDFSTGTSSLQGTALFNWHGDSIYVVTDGTNPISVSLKAGKINTFTVKL